MGTATVEELDTERSEYLSDQERNLLRQSLDLLKKKTEKLISDLASVRLDTNEADALLTDIGDVRSVVPALAGDYDLTRAQRGCIAAALSTYLDELAKTQKSEEKIGVSTNATDIRRFEVGALAQKLGVAKAEY